jgi:hypothetical protein
VSGADVQAVREVAIPTLDKTLVLLGDAKSLVMNWFEAETINFFSPDAIKSYSEKWRQHKQPNGSPESRP